MPLQAQFGVAEESSYGTAVTVSRFYEILDGESLRPRVSRLANMGKRAGQRVRRAATPVPVDGGGSVPMLVGTKGHGLLLKHALGSVATTGPTDSAYTHVFTLASLTGKFLTAQIGRELVGGSTMSPETYAGGKIIAAEWSLTKGDDGFLKANYTFDTKFPATGTALATASYPTPLEAFPWSNAALTVDGSSVEVFSATIGLTSAMKVDRVFLGNSKKEPLQNGMVEVAFSFECEFTSLAHYNRVMASVKASSIAPIVLTCTGLDLIGTSTYPSIAFSIPDAQFDELDGPGISDDGPIATTVSGKATWDLSDQPFAVTYVSADATP